MKTLDHHIADAATSKGPPEEKNNIIPLHPLSEAQDLSRSVLKRQLDESLEIETLQRLTREMNEFAQRLIAVKSPRLGAFAKSVMAVGDTIFKAALEGKS